MKLVNALGSRDNNFNLMRFAAASLVLISHSFTIVTGDANQEPLRSTYGLTLGSISVDIFFIISGVLITRSMDKCDSGLQFILLRFLRIIPGLLMALTSTVFVIGSAYYDWNPIKLLESTDAVEYILNNSIPFGKMEGHVSGGRIFSTNPAGTGFNASLWTLPAEVQMYRNVLLAWLVSFIFMGFRKAAFRAIIAAWCIYYLCRHFAYFATTPIEDSAFRLHFMFFAGAAAYIFSNHVSLRNDFAALAVGAVVLASVNQVSLFLCYSFVLWYLVLWAANIPEGMIREFNKFGDCSYGVYIYAWPVQQSFVAVFPQRSVYFHIFASFCVTLFLAVLSWKYIEHPALNLKRKILKA